MVEAVNIFWFRRDLRLNDNAGLYRSLKEDLPVLPVFIFDTNILEDLDNKEDARVEFIHKSLQQLNKQLASFQSSVRVYHGTPENIFRELLQQYAVKKVFTNHDYEPYAIDRDGKVRKMLGNAGVILYTDKDHVIFEKNEVMKEDGSPYVVFTPYSRKWKQHLNDSYISSYSTEKYFSNFYKSESHVMPSLADIGFKESSLLFPRDSFTEQMVMNYKNDRDFPGVAGTSRLGIHLRFGTMSVRSLVHHVKNISEVFLNELIWREFYQMILWQFPHIGKGQSFRKEYDRIEWRNNQNEFNIWCEGQTGYPMVDAGMRELNKTGFMHNRVRMVTASFLTKHLLIDWRWGEAYFANRLLDFEFASNNGGWQWAAGSGCDAAPYFRIFNPALQMKKFDPDLSYVKRWVPEFGTSAYPLPVVEHNFARARCLQVYGRALRRET